MITTFRDNKTKTKHNFTTQQYKIGLYLIIDNNAFKQSGLANVKEIDFHKDLRKEIKKNKDILIEEESSVL